MFGAINTQLPDTITTYEEAHAKWASIKPIRGRGDQNTRPLARRGNDNLTIRQDTRTNDIVVRLYSTDIVTYHQANHITLEPYASALTNRIISSLFGYTHLHTHWADRDRSAPDHITGVNGRYYNTPDYAYIRCGDPEWTLVSGAKPFEVPRLDRKGGKQALRDANYYTFKLWLETRVRLGVIEFGYLWPRSPYKWTPRQAWQYLTAGEEGWAEIVGRMSSSTPLERELESLRRAVYSYAGCYDTETVEYFDSWQQLDAALRQMRRVTRTTWPT
jgi:hypothetical protein